MDYIKEYNKIIQKANEEIRTILMSLDSKKHNFTRLEQDKTLTGKFYELDYEVFIPTTIFINKYDEIIVKWIALDNKKWVITNYLEDSDTREICKIANILKNKNDKSI